MIGRTAKLLMVQYDAGAASRVVGGREVERLPQVSQKAGQSRIGALLLKQYGGVPVVSESLVATPPAGEMSAVRKRWYLSAVPGPG